MIVPRYYEDLDVLHENTMPNRAYYIPASARMDTLGEERLKSDRFQLLNGSWLFRYYDSIYDLQEPFYAVKPPATAGTGKPAEAAGTAEAAAAFGTGAAEAAAAFGTGTAGTAAETEHHFTHVPVPGTWQNYGCDEHQYTNFRYPFPADPPYVPQENPCGAYIHHFPYTPDEDAPEVYLNFEGVDSCFYVWLNGRYVGYSQIAHATAEFCVTDFLQAGDNKLAVLVLKWCDGSYLEDQDKFRTSGIFRDVYLLKRPKACLYDYFVHTEIEHTPDNDDSAEGSTQGGAGSDDAGTAGRSVQGAAAVKDSAQSIAAGTAGADADSAQSIAAGTAGTDTDSAQSIAADAAGADPSSAKNTAAGTAGADTDSAQSIAAGTAGADTDSAQSMAAGEAAGAAVTGRVVLEMDFLNGCVPVKATLYDEENTPVAEVSIAAQKLYAAETAAAETTEETSAKAEAQAAAAGEATVETAKAGSAAAESSAADETAAGDTTAAQAAGDALPLKGAPDVQLLHCAPVTLEVENPVLWNPEKPYLYTLVLETPGEVITEQVGFRKVEIRDAVVYLNGNPIKFRGVNRHESYPVTGPVVSQKQIETDLRMIRRHNFNAIRASHYPNVPYFYQLCDRYGFMVIDEADNESHGPWMLCYQNDCDAERAGRWNELISDNPAFIEATVDRTRSMVERNKNRPCILVWSMGNEGGYGITFERALAWTKERDPSRLTHYESAFYRGKGRDYDYSNIDLYSRMYPDFQDVIDYAEGHSEKDYPDKPAEAEAAGDTRKACAALEPGADEQKAVMCSAADAAAVGWETEVESAVNEVAAGRETEASFAGNEAAAGETTASVQNRPRRPFLMCEYAHSMGNGPGDFEDYFELIDRYDSVCGGFVWEWCDHAVYKGTSGAGKPIYLYGGDHGEYPHDGNFCMDGLVYPDRRPHTGLLEFKNVHRPARVVSYDQASGTLVLKNEMNFTDLHGYISLKYEVRADGVLTASGEIPAREIPPIAPRQTGKLKLAVPVPEKGRSFLKISYILEKEFALAGQAAREVILEKGFVSGFDEILLQNADGRHQEAARLCAPAGMPAKTDIAAEKKYAAEAGTEDTAQPTAASGRTDGGEHAVAASRTGGGEQAAASGRTDGGKQAAGTEIAEETAACGAGKSADVNAAASGGNIEITESDRCLELAGVHFLYRFNKLTGLFTECIVDEQALLAEEMTLSLWRAPTDNDSAIRLEWDKAQYERAMPRAYETTCVQTDDAVYICTKMAVTAVSVQKILDIDAVWTVDRQGGMALKMDVTKNEEFPELPRFGLKLMLPGEMNRVSYYGLGPMESYRDKCRAAAHGLYENTVAGMHEDYLKPQENGSHADTSIVKIYSGSQPKREPADADAAACADSTGAPAREPADADAAYESGAVPAADADGFYGKCAMSPENADSLFECGAMPPTNADGLYACGAVPPAGSTGKNLSLTAAAETPFSFNVSPYTEQELTKKKHSFELEPCGYTVLHLDYAQNGIGSNSCGPRPKEKYRFDERAFTFSIKLIPGAI